MKRISLNPRPYWQGTVESQGFVYHSNGERPVDDGGSHWNERVCYQFSSEEVEEIEAATSELYRLCVYGADHIISSGRLSEVGVPNRFQDAVVESWRRRDPSVYGRFDLAYNGLGPPKLLEFNADTPTTLIESAIVQWHWLTDRYPDEDQFNGLHEMLVARWRQIGSRMATGSKIHFSSIKTSLEEYSTVEYLRDTAQQAGLETSFCHIEDIGFRNGTMVDLAGEPIKYWFKLYPWEWLTHEEFAPHLARSLKSVGVIEPPWKMVLSTKAILPVLWELFPGHPNLLPAYWSRHPDLSSNYVEKPMFGREGKNIALHGDDSMFLPGPYSEERMVFQRRADLGRVDGQWFVIGSWVVGDKPAGMCLREDNRPIIVAESAIVPHFIAA